MKICPLKITVLFLTLILITSSAFAHEYILMAYNYIVEKGKKLELHLFVADGFNIELERPVQKNMIMDFELISENGKRDLLQEVNDGAFPILDMEVDFSGLGLIHMTRDYAGITLANDEFKNYLKVDHIENITIDDSTKTAQREKYTRYIKTLVQSNRKNNDSLYQMNVGHTFEIILLQNPYLLTKNDRIKAKVLFKGKPLKNKVITARNRNGSEPAIARFSRTDNQGICSFKLERYGDWFIHATHMIPAKDLPDTDWESFWTSFSFGLVENMSH